MGSNLRPIAEPFVVAAPEGTSVRTRLRLSEHDASVLRELGAYMGRLQGKDLAVRCAEGHLDAKRKAESRTGRSRVLRGECPARWAGTITRVSEGQYQQAEQNLRRERASLQRRIRTIETRAAVPVGEKRSRIKGYATPSERYWKLIRLKSLRARLAGVDQKLAHGRVSVVRGGKALLRKRSNLDSAGMTVEEWRAEWEAERLFLKADGDRSARWGNWTISWNPLERSLDVNLPASLTHLANRPHGRYRLSCPVEFKYRGDEVAAQAEAGSISYDITLNPETGRWYLSAGWKRPPAAVAMLEELRVGPVVAVDLNDGHIEAAVISADGNVLGAPSTIPLNLGGLPASTRDGRLRAAVTSLITMAKDHGAQAIVIENLDFAEARTEGRERTGNRPSRGKRGKAYRRTVAGIPTAKFRDRVTQMASNASLSVVAIDPAYTSRWAAVHWLAHLREQHPETTGHHAAAMVIGRRGLGHRARKRVNGNRVAPEEAARLARTRTRKPPKAKHSSRKPSAPRDQRQPHGGKTGRPHGITAGNQATEDRSRSPAEPIPLSSSD